MIRPISYTSDNMKSVAAGKRMLEFADVLGQTKVLLDLGIVSGTDNRQDQLIDIIFKS